MKYKLNKEKKYEERWEFLFTKLKICCVGLKFRGSVMIFQCLKN